MVLNLEGTTDLSDVREIKVYSTGTVNAFDERHPQNATLLGSIEPASSDLTCNLEGNLFTGTNYLWVVAHVADNATEGNMIDVSLKSITTTEETYELANPSPAGSREIILAHTLLLQPGDYNSTNYRIPAVITAKDGSIVAVTDKRKYNEGDLPEDIDIVCNRSTDGGHTWSEPYTIALGTGVNHGFGDCALAWSNDDNGLIAGFVGGPGLWYSTPSNPIRTYICKSYDNGQTWTEPEDITNSLVTTVSSPHSAHGAPRSLARAMACAPPRVVSCLWLPSVRIRRKYSTTMPFIPTTTAKPGMCRVVPPPLAMRLRLRSWPMAAS